MEDKTLLVSKLLLCGAYKVGKTSIRRSYMGEGFIADHLSTLGADFSVQKIDLNPDLTLELQIWDLAGQSGFESLRQRFFQGASCCFMIFDLTNKASFNELSDWLNQIWKEQDKYQIPLLIIGNKNDLPESTREVDDEDVEQFINDLREEHGLDDLYINYIRTSAKTGENIEEAFIAMSNVLYNNWKAQSDEE